MSIAYHNVVDASNEHALAKDVRFDANGGSPLFAIEQRLQNLMWFVNEIEWCIHRMIHLLANFLSTDSD